MAYILTAQLDAEEVPFTAFARYQEYLTSVRAGFPPQAFALATSRWYFNNTDHRAPHDAWLEEARFVEVAAPDDRAARRLDFQVRLLGAYHDGWIELRYHDVSRYRLDYSPPRQARGRGHGDWRYDEFRLAAGGRVEHEIEWWSARAVGNWLIEAADVAHHWIPMADPSSSESPTSNVR